MPRPSEGRLFISIERASHPIASSRERRVCRSLSLSERLRPVVKEQPAGHAPRHVPPVLSPEKKRGRAPIPAAVHSVGEQRCDSEVQDFSSLPRAGRKPFVEKPRRPPPVGAPLRTCAGATQTMEEGEKLFFFSSDHSRPQIGRDHPLNLSISLSGGKETNEDSLSSGE